MSRATDRNEHANQVVNTWFDPLEEELMVVEPLNDPEVDLPGGPRQRPGVGGGHLRKSVLGVRRKTNVRPDAAVDAWLDEAMLDEIRYAVDFERHAVHHANREILELPSTIEAFDLAQAGWGLVLPRRAPPGVREALAPLIDLRQRQAGRRFKTLTYHHGDDTRRFLEHRYGEPPGVIDPARVPYYLLIIGGPETVPFSVQSELGLGRAVGRLSFDAPSIYRHYARAVVAAETRPRSARSGSCAFFAPRNRDDVALDRMNRHLVHPLAAHLRAGSSDWTVGTWAGQRATKAQLARLLGGDETADLMLVGCHGLATDLDGPAARYQGSLICHDSAASASAAVPERCFSVDDLEGLEFDALRAAVVFLVACHGAGTPVEESFAPSDPELGRRILSPRPVLSALPPALLAHGALAVIGHVDRAWTLGFSWLLEGEVRDAAATYKDIFARLLAGQRVGHAMRPAARRFAALAAYAAPLLERALEGEPVDRQQLRVLCLAMNDARNMVVLGDPAARPAATAAYPPSVA